MPNDEDRFEDVPEASALGGIFAGDGLQSYTSVPTELKRDGLWVTTRCEPGRNSCGMRAAKVQIEWYPLMCIAMGFPPMSQGFVYDTNKAVVRSPERCPCGAPWPFGLTQQECQAALKRAESYGYLNPAQLQQLAAAAGQERAQLAQAMQQRR